MGVTISLDDFGTGYASLSQLQSLPFDRIKIDKSFVTSLAVRQPKRCDRHDHPLARQSLHLPITAEGIEDDGTKDRPSQLGCSDGQGWLFGKAVCGSTVRASLGIEPNGAKLAPVETPEVPANERRDRKRRAAGGKR